VVKRRLGVLWATVGIGCAAALYSCRQVAGIQEDPVEKLTSTACGLPHGTTECASCVQANCCSESTACSGDRSCALYFQCLGGCATGDWACRAQCRYDNPYSTASELPALYSCTVRHCEGACGLTCGAAEYALPTPDAAAACQSCLAGNGDCNRARACTSTVDCLSWSQCYNDCPTPDCQQACQSADDAGAALATAIDPEGLCSPACALGTNWACVGHVNWPDPTTKATTLTASVIDFVSQKAVPGVTAKVCEFQSCDAPLGYGATDSHGELTIQVPALAPHVMGLAEDSYAVLTSPTLTTTLFFWGYPVSEPKAPIGAPELYVSEAAEWQAAFATQGVSWDSSRGILGVLVRDCRLTFAAGVKLSLSGAGMRDPAIRPFYLVNHQDLDFSAMETDGTTGVGGFINVPAGEFTVTAKPDALGGVPSSTARIYIEAGTLTEVFLEPIP
jgi:hypothetical protein